MSKRYIWLVVLIALIAFITASCSRATEGIIIEKPEISAHESPGATAGSDKMIVFDDFGISFSYPAFLATGVTIDIVAGEEPYYPVHKMLVFDNYIHADAFKTPALRLFITDEYTRISEYAVLQVNDLKKYITDFDSVTGDEYLPFLPDQMAGQHFYAHTAPISFKNGKVIRYLTQYVQDISPVTNDSLFYTFQGLTTDGQTYISFVLPVSHSDLTDDWDNFFNTSDYTYETFSDNYHYYMMRTVDMVHKSDYEMFTPSLFVLDDIVMSLKVD